MRAAVWWFVFAEGNSGGVGERQNSSMRERDVPLRDLEGKTKSTQIYQ